MELARRMLEAWTRRDVEATIELVDEETEWTPVLTPGGPEGTVYRGPEAMRDWFSKLDEVWTGLRVDDAEFRDLGGDRVLQLGRFRAVGKGSGVPIDQPQALLFEFKEGKVIRIRGFASHKEALEAAGLDATA